MNHAQALPVQESEDQIVAVERVLEHMYPVIDQAHLRSLVQAVTHLDRPRVLAFLNQYSFNLCWESEEFRDMMLSSDLLVRDGSSINLCMRMVGREPGINMAGTDVMPMIARAFVGRRVGVVGTRAPYNELAAQWLRDAGLEVVCVLDGFADEDSYLPAIRQARPELVFLGMGMPKQERIAARMVKELDFPVLLMNGGAMLDFMARRVLRAPLWMRRLGMEWFYRLLREPRRLGRRYIIGGACFASRILRLGLSARRQDQSGEATKANRAPWPVLQATNASRLFTATDANLTALVQRVDAGLSVSRGRIVQFMGAGTGEGISTVAQSYAGASASLRQRHVLLLSNDLAGPEDRWPDREHTQPQRSGVTCARLFDTSLSYEENYARLAARSTWSDLREAFDEIVIDSDNSFALTTVGHSDGVVVIVEAEATPSSVVKTLLDNLAALNAAVVGVVLNKKRNHLPRLFQGRV